MCSANRVRVRIFPKAGIQVMTVKWASVFYQSPTFSHEHLHLTNLSWNSAFGQTIIQRGKIGPWLWSHPPLFNTYHGPSPQKRRWRSTLPTAQCIAPTRLPAHLTPKLTCIKFAFSAQPAFDCELLGQVLH